MSVKTAIDTRRLTLCAVMAAVMCVLAPISVPIGPISLTGGTLAIYLTACLLGGRWGAVTTLVYPLLGFVGLPVFSGFQGGPGVLLGTTGGYIIGFIGSALVYWLVTAKLGNRTPVVACGCLLGLLVCYAFGTAWFLALYTSTKGPISLAAALAACVVPFIVPDLLKIVLAVLLARRVGKYLK